MTTIYFIRHAQSDHSVHDDVTRPLTEKGLRDRSLVSDYLDLKGVSAVFSSPYKRAYDTVAEFAQRKNLDIVCMDKFRERSMANMWVDDFASFSMQQWKDFDYKMAAGESLREVQNRNIEALHYLLSTHPNETMVVGTHGTALSTIVNYFDHSFTYERFKEIVWLMPWIVAFVFEGDRCISIDSINPFEL